MYYVKAFIKLCNIFILKTRKASEKNYRYNTLNKVSFFWVFWGRFGSFLGRFWIIFGSFWVVLGCFCLNLLLRGTFETVIKANVQKKKL